ncbi:MAG: GatB/YqeY domain-containing protein [Candidatus Kerfeldbacteria bacterium]|nr:GatB/YqeY domain-containing protein [Candidatus Kerfeldbacteria bacterium]
MSLYSTILSDLTAAMKAKDTERLNALRMVKSSLLLALKEKGPSVTELSDDEVLAVLQREAKKRKDSISQFDAGGRQDLADSERRELSVIQAYLPAQMSEAEIEHAVAGIIAEHAGAPFAAVMGKAMQLLRGKADGAQVRAVVERLTSTS